MALISTLSFAKDPKWNVPGPEFPISAFSSGYGYKWANSIAKGATSKLAPAIPSWTGRPPEAEYWKAKVSKLEWPSVAPIWQNLSRSILLSDPYFRPFREPWYVTREGVWTPQFANHPTFGVMVDWLAMRMNEELGSVEKLLKKLETGPQKTSGINYKPNDPKGAFEPSHFSDDPIDNAPVEAGIENTLWLPSWRQVAEFGYRGFTMGRLFTPTGLGWLVVEKTASYGIHRYQNYRRESARAKERAQRGPYYAVEETELPFGAWENDEVRGFEQPGFELPIWAVRSASANDFDWPSLPSAPKFLMSQDGLFI